MADSIADHARRCYPRECCGLIVANQAYPAKNLYSGRGGYRMDPLAVLSTPGPIQAIYHSHCDAPALFSATDTHHALIDGQPAWPGVEYWILRVDRDQTGPIHVYVWHAGVFRLASVETTK